LTSEKWFSIKQQHVESEYNNSLGGNTKPPSPVTLHIDFWCCKCITSHNSNAIEAHKYMSLRSFWLPKNDFPSSNNLLKVNMTVVWLETPSHHHQSLQILIFGVENVSQAIILMLLKLISKWVWGLFDFWKIIFHQATTYWKWI